MTEMTHKEKIRLAGIAKHGSEEAWRKAKSEQGKRASRPGTGGFNYLKRTNPEQLSELSRKAARARWGEER